jgi:NDP-sugar pyrophosphorylase family protein
MIAMIFAAGLGTRLAPLTNNCPKALVNFMGKTMLENVSDKLVKAGCTHIVVNIHHFPEMMRNYISNLNINAEITISDESDMLLDTGGGILKARHILESEPNFILHNVDIACNIDLKKLYKFHTESGNLATLAVKKRNSSRNLIFDNTMHLCAWRDNRNNITKQSRPYNEADSQALAFSGISVLSRDIFPLITETGKFSITDLFLRLAADGRIGGYLHNDLWADLGSIEKIHDAEILFSNTSQESAED